MPRLGAPSSAVLQAYQYRGIYYHSNGGDIGIYTVAAPDRLTTGLGCVTIETDFVIDDANWIKLDAVFSLVAGSWAKERLFKCAFRLGEVTDVIAFVGLLDQPYSVAKKYIGFKVVNNQLYAVNNDATGEMATAIKTITTAKVTVETMFQPARLCSFYVDGVYGCSHTQKLPFGGGGHLIWSSAYVQTKVAAAKGISLTDVTFIQKP